jgi:hypothetical protein
MQAAHLLTLHLGPFGAPFFFPGFFFLFHPGLFWLAALLLLVLWKRSDGYRRHGHAERSAAPAAPPPAPERPVTRPDGDGPAWPALHPDEPARAERPAGTPQGKAAQGKIEYF